MEKTGKKPNIIMILADDQGPWAMHLSLIHISRSTAPDSSVAKGSLCGSFGIFVAKIKYFLQQ